MCVSSFAKCNATNGSIVFGAVFDVGSGDVDSVSVSGIFVVAAKAVANSCESAPEFDSMMQILKRIFHHLDAGRLTPIVLESQRQKERLSR